jgi:hypothetical protein
MDLLNLHLQHLIHGPEAVRHATNPEALTMALRGITSSKAPEAAKPGGMPKIPRPPQAMPAENRGH